MIGEHRLDLTPVAQFAIGVDHKIIFWNRACEILTGYSATEMLGTQRQWEPFYGTKRPVLADLIIENDLKNLLQLYENQNIQQSRLVPHAWEAAGLYSVNREQRHLHFLAAPILDREGALIGAMETLLEALPETVSLSAAGSEPICKITERYESSDRNTSFDFSNIIGKSMAMREIFEHATKAAATNANVIIYGESGTGKELIAKAIHGLSNRCERKFIAVNCSAIPENLIESEFFGYKKGAFTGADRDKPGFLDRADGGTLFLDEVGEVSKNMQVKLLRTIEGYGFLSVGSTETQKTDIRIIAATRRNLMDDVKNGQMRDDFFYRIHIIPIHIPPLRSRKEDILPLAEHFLILHGGTDEKISISARDVKRLLFYDWPGMLGSYRM
jgi:transcriptional regulator with PAS, ATPase and Fis domain